MATLEPAGSLCSINASIRAESGFTGVTVSWGHNGSRQTDKINSNNILFINIFIFKGKSTTILQMNNNEVVFS